MAEMEQTLYASTKRELPDRQSLEIRIAEARRAAAVIGFPNTSGPAKERLAVYEKQYIDAYSLLEFVKFFGVG